MKVRYLTSASVIIEHKNTKILCDPWLVDGEYYGSWCHYPKLDFKPEDFDNVDFIYLSHIHPDHSSIKTLKKMKKSIPILIHNYHAKFLKRIIESLGFSVIELHHDKRTHLKDELYINILAADDCNPELCHKYFGCSMIENNFGSTSIDSMAVFDNGDEVIVNTNDCPFLLANQTTLKVKAQYPKIDMLLVGYTSASAFPQCFQISDNKKDLEKKRLQKMYVDYAEKYVHLLNPRYFLPFAGRYVLAGKLSNLNSNKGAYELEEAFEYFSNISEINSLKNKCVILNSQEYFDISLEKSSKKYTPIKVEEKNNYIDQVLSKKKLDYEDEEFPTHHEIISKIPKAYEHFEEKRKELQFSSETKIIIQISKFENILLSCDGGGFKIISSQESEKIKNFVKLELDLRLLKWILDGPRYANWNNAEIGSHIIYQRYPDKYERGLYYCLSYFHS